MAGPEIGYFRGSGGIVFDYELPLSEMQQYQATRGELVRVAADGGPYVEPATETEEEPAAPKPPAKNASKNEWVGYARLVDEDLSVDDADAMTRDELAEKYGSK